jgi:dTDP-4-amino-4,6-dideoxygalactose transaminase/dienelactone hydrolase
MQNARVNRLLERPPLLRFAAADGDPRQWARRVRAAVQRLALPSGDAVTDSDHDGDGTYTLVTAGGPVVGSLTLPEGSGEHPAVLLIGAPSSVSAALRDKGVASFELRFDPADSDEADRALVLAGRCMLAARADDALAALGWLAAHPRVRADQIGLYGAGDGGPVALHAALLHTEPLPVVAVGHLGSYATSTPPPGCSLPGVLRQVDLPDLYAALLPRPLLVQSDAGEDARAATDQIALAYKAAEADDAFAAGTVDPAAAVDFFSRWLTAPRPTPVVPPLRVRFDVPARLEVADRIDQVLASGMLTQGQVVLEFEKVATRWTGFPALAVSTGSSALDIAYNLVGVAGRTVLVPVNTFFATASSAVRAGANVDFVDIELDGFGMDPDALAAALDRHDDVAAVTVVHIGGVVSPSVLAVRDLCAARGIPLLEDSAHSLGSRFDGQLSGTFGRMSTFSLHPAKVVTSGEGGLIGLSDDGDYQQAQLWRDHGKMSIDRNVHDRLGTNWRLSEVHASVGLAHFGQLDALLAERRRLVAFYDENLDSVPLVRRYQPPAGVESNYYKYMAFLDPSINRAELKARLKRNHGVSLAGEVYDVLLSDQPYFAEAFAGRTFDRGAWFTAHHICLPAFPSMTTAEQLHVLHALKTELS